MRIVIRSTPVEVAEYAAAVVREEFERRSGHMVLGLATGSTPLGTYQRLARLVEAGEMDFSAVQGFALDEYVGLSYAHPESYHAVIDAEVTRPLRMNPNLVHVPDGNADDVDAAAAAYDEAIAEAGGIDLQILGIGHNGHIGFNEPTSSFASRTRMTVLSRRTREANARFFDSLDEVPTAAVTQGLGTILDARRALLVALGEGKADAVAAMIEGPQTSMCPASVLQLHREAIIVIDEGAASKLQFADFYREEDAELSEAR